MAREMALGCSRSRTHTPPGQTLYRPTGAGAPWGAPRARRHPAQAPRRGWRACRRLSRLSATRSDAAAARPGASVGRTHAARGLAGRAGPHGTGVARRGAGLSGGGPTPGARPAAPRARARGRRGRGGSGTRVYTIMYDCTRRVFERVPGDKSRVARHAGPGGSGSTTGLNSESSNNVCP